MGWWKQQILQHSGVWILSVKTVIAGCGDTIALDILSP